MAEAVRLLCDARAMIGETPIAFGSGVQWTDPVARRLLQWAGELQTTATDQPIWSLAMLPDGAVVGARDDALGLMERQGGWRFGPTATLDAGCRFNDMAVDPDGGLWVGAMHRGVLATRGSLYRAASIDARPERVASGLGVPNGMKTSADGGTLFVVDTLERTLLAYPRRGGALGEPTIVTDFMGLPGKPDGMTIDPGGTFHVAMWGGGCVAHIAADGATLGRTDLPAPHVSSLCLTGSGRLAVTTSRMRLSEAALATHPLSGGLFEIALEAAA
jgi:sugar lactone lactonase YvrE